MKMRLSCACIAGIAALAAAAGQSSADTVAFSPSGGSIMTTYNDVGNDGLKFTVGNSNITVTSLGYFHDGTVHTNPVGIYQFSGGSLVAQANVTTTNGAVAGASFDYQSISPIVLLANTTYELVGQENYTNTSDISGQYVTTANAAHMNPASGITFDGYYYDYNGSLDLPGIAYGNSYQGPNFQFEISPAGGPAAVPVPASAFGGSALLGLLFFAKRRAGATRNA